MKMLIVLIPVIVLVLAVLIVRDQRKTRAHPTDAKRASLQDFLRLDGFHASGVLQVAGAFHELVAVGNVNLYALSSGEIQALRDQYKAMLQRLDEPFQIVVQARRANERDYVEDTTMTIRQANESYQNVAFSRYSEGLVAYLQTEASRLRQEYENLMVVGALPSIKESEAQRLERVEQERQRIEQGLTNMAVPHRVLGETEAAEAIQHFWSPHRAISQRYRDLLRHGAYAPVIDGEIEVRKEEVLRA